MVTWSLFSSFLPLAWGIDLALSSNAAAFLQHSVVGGPSYDAFAFSPSNPVYSGSGYWPWVVNGFYYELQPGNTTSQCIMAGEYPSGYFEGAHPARMRALYSDDDGVTFTVGPIVVAGNASLYDKGGHTPDGSVVVEGSLTHIVYDWATPTNSDGGLGYASGPSRGPFVRSPTPLVSESTMPLLPQPQYRRVYGGTLLRRSDSDWIVLAAISTAHNGGGTWGLCCLSAPSADGPWSEPALLLTPQSSGWHAHPTEFYPAFTDGSGFVYAPATSISSNRNYQLIWRAPLSSAHLPNAWEVLSDGSAFHWDGQPGTGSIWGQTFSAFVDPVGVLRVMFPSLSASSVGSLNVATVPWIPVQSGGGSIGQRAAGFFVSAPVVDSFTLTTGSLGAEMSLSVVAAASGPALAFSLVWTSSGPVGADTWPFPGGMDARTGCDLTTLALSTTGFRLLSLPPGNGCVARAVTIATGPSCALISGAPQQLFVVQSATGLVNISCDGTAAVLNAQVQRPGGATSLVGRAGIYAASGTAVNVTSFSVLSGWLDAPPPFTLLAVDAMTGAGNLAAGWRKDTRESLWRFGDGLVCDASSDCEHTAKWNFAGVGVVLWAPRGIAGTGNVTLSIDGGLQETIDLSADSLTPSAPVWVSSALTAGRHALTVMAAGAVALPIDSIEVMPSPVGGK